MLQERSEASASEASSLTCAPLPRRLQAALARVRVALVPHCAEIALVALEPTAVRLRLSGSYATAALASAQRALVVTAVQRACPELCSVTTTTNAADGGVYERAFGVVGAQ
jgi:hypothetical protein